MSQVSPERTGRRYIGTPEVAKRYGRAVRTIQRWLKDPPPGMPRPILHNGRWIWVVDELDVYDEGNRQQPNPEAA